MDGHLGNNVATGYNASEMSLRSSSSRECMALSWEDLDLASFVHTRFLVSVPVYEQDAFDDHSFYRTCEGLV